MSRESICRTALAFLATQLIAISAQAGERFLLGSPNSDDPVCSILVPTGWYPDGSTDESGDTYRFVFEPIKGMYPSIILDIDEKADVERLRATWNRNLKRARLLDSVKSSQKYFDEDRHVAWQMESSEHATSISVEVLKHRSYSFRFVTNERASQQFLDTVIDIIDMCDFAPAFALPPPASRETLAKRFGDTEFIPFQLSQEDRIGIEGFRWKLGLLVGCVVLGLAVIERILRSRRDAQRIAEAEASIEERKSPQHGRRKRRRPAGLDDTSTPIYEIQIAE